MRDQRIEFRPTFGGEEPRHRPGVAGVGAQAVDGLGRKRDEPTLGERARCGYGRGRLGSHHPGRQIDSHLRLRSRKAELEQKDRNMQADFAAPAKTAAARDSAAPNC